MRSEGLDIGNLAVATTRATLGLFAACMLVVIDARPSFAETYRPWCVQYSGRGGRDCGFTSYDQCMMTATPGSGGSCVKNPWYVWYGGGGTTGQGGARRR